MDLEIIDRFHELKTKVNEVKNFDSMLPSDNFSIEMLIQWIAYFITPSFDSLDDMTHSYGISLTAEERSVIYPQIIEFILFIKKKFLQPVS